MFKKALTKVIAKLAVLAMLMVSLVPTLTLAFPTQNSKSFVQEVCSRQSGQLLIQVITTQGKQLSTLIDYQPSQKPVSLSHHLTHCPFCSMALDDIFIPAQGPTALLFQQLQVNSTFRHYQTPSITGVYITANAPRAPPLTLISI